MRIAEYRELPVGERALYNQYALFKLETESKTPACPLFKKA
jgi:hypothetical protein